MIQPARTKAKVETTPKTVRVAIYTRKSKQPGHDQALTSLHVQREIVLEYVKARRTRGWVALQESYDDGGRKGETTDRPAFQRLLTDIEAGKVDVVACYKHDRLSRSFLDFYRLLEFFEQHAVSFVSVTQDFDTSKPLGRLLQNILMSFAEFESEQIRERVRDKKLASRKRGLWPGGRPPLGYDLNGKGLTVNKREAEVVRGIYEAYLRLGSLPAVAQFCCRQDWKAKRHRYRSGRVHGGKDFTYSTLSPLLKNPVYMGKLRGEDGPYDGIHEAIVDEETWQRVQEMLKANSGEKRHPRRNNGVLLGGGLLKCGVCGETMGHMTCRQGGRVYRYYRCATLARDGASACPGSRVTAADIEGFVLGKVQDLGKDADVIAQTMEAARTEFEARKPALVAELQRLGQLRQKLESQQETILDAVGDGEERPKVVVKRLQRLEEEIDGLAAEQERIRADLAAMKGQALDETQLREALADFDELWGELFPVEQARIVQLVIERVEYHAPKGGVGIDYRPGGLQALIEERQGDGDGLVQG
jgi:site-specific DNA recombinase